MLSFQFSRLFNSYFHSIFTRYIELEVYKESFIKLFDVLLAKIQIHHTHKTVLCLFCLMYITFCDQKDNEVAIPNLQSQFLDVWLKKESAARSKQDSNEELRVSNIRMSSYFIYCTVKAAWLL